MHNKELKEIDQKYKEISLYFLISYPLRISFGSSLSLLYLKNQNNTAGFFFFF